ncbi:MAG: hypothetical protein ACRD72_01675, partial [Candidatus Angelobacter sp.]
FPSHASEKNVFLGGVYEAFSNTNNIGVCARLYGADVWLYNTVSRQQFRRYAERLVICEQ